MRWWNEGGRLRARPRGGYILLMILVLLVIMMTALASLAQRSLRTSQQAIATVGLLQQRWGIDSCRELILPRIAIVFQGMGNPRPADRPSPSATFPNFVGDSVVLGEQRFDLVISDENTKLNLNTLYHRGGPTKLSQTIRRFVGPFDARALMLQPAVASSYRPQRQDPSRRTELTTKRPEASQASADGEESEAIEAAFRRSLPAFRSWGEVFDLATFADTGSGSEVRLDFTQKLTLWGNGQVNVRRAAEEVILAQAELVVPPATAKSLLRKFRQPDSDLQTIFETDIERPVDRRALASLFATSSFAYSFFIDARSSVGQSRRLYVYTTDVDGSTQTIPFVFH